MCRPLAVPPSLTCTPERLKAQPALQYPATAKATPPEVDSDQESSCGSVTGQPVSRSDTAMSWSIAAEVKKGEEARTTMETFAALTRMPNTSYAADHGPQVLCGYKCGLDSYSDSLILQEVW